MTLLIIEKTHKVQKVTMAASDHNLYRGVRKTISLPLSDGQNHGSAFLPAPTENYVG
jgi:hypothetical protein